MAVSNEIRTEHYKFFQHADCEFFPCHEVKRRGGIQLPVLLLSAVRSGGRLRRRIPIYGYRHQGLHELHDPAQPWRL